MTPYFPPARQRGITILDVADFGARGDGISDDTAAIQNAINALPPDGGTVLVKRPGDYLVDAGIGLALRSLMAFQQLPGARLAVIPNALKGYQVLRGVEIHDVEIRNPQMLGDRGAHTFSADNTHEWGFGIQLRNCTGVNVIGGLIERMTGDGLAGSGRDIVVAFLTSLRNRRQGLTLYEGAGYVVHGCNLSFTGALDGQPGTSPSAGIDVEPNAGVASNIVIRDCWIEGNGTAGVLLAHGPKHPENGIDDVTITGNTITGGSNAIGMTGSTNVRIGGNWLRRNGSRAIRLDAGSDTIDVTDNRFSASKARVPSLVAGLTPDINVRAGATNATAGLNFYD